MDTALAVGAAAYFAPLMLTILRSPDMFTRRYARRHRLLGAALLAVLLGGWTWVLSFRLQREQTGRNSDLDPIHVAGYNIVLGVLGVSTTLAAAGDFRAAHAKVRNPASGALSTSAVVTVDEMVEHAFYQGLNLGQAVFMALLPLTHASGAAGELARWAMLAALASAWAVRASFPVNSFSANWTRHAVPDTGLITWMYRAKKAQYLLWKHCLWWGLLVSLVMAPGPLVSACDMQLYWVSLNTAYVMEFFMQTLVRKGHLRQSIHLVLNNLLMLIATAATLPVVLRVNPAAAALSLLLNFVHRGHELQNIVLVSFAAVGLRALAA